MKRYLVIFLVIALMLSTAIPVFAEGDQGLKRIVDSLVSQVSQLGSDMQNLTDRISKIETNNDSVEARIDQLENDIAKQKSLNAQQQQIINSQQENIKSLEAKVKDLSIKKGEVFIRVEVWTEGARPAYMWTNSPVKFTNLDTNASFYVETDDEGEFIGWVAEGRYKVSVDGYESSTPYATGYVTVLPYKQTSTIHLAVQK